MHLAEGAEDQLMSRNRLNNRRSFSTSNLSRRRFLQASAALGMGSGLSSFGMRSVRADERISGETLRVAFGHGESTDSLDPAKFIGGFMQAFSFARYNCLTEIAPDGSLQPELAESWEPSPDAKRWVFNIRQGIEFHSGKPLDSTDVLASIDHHRNEDSGSAMKPVVDQIEHMKTDGPHRIIITLSSGNADFAFTLSDYHMVICPVVDGQLDWQSGVGTGPYIMREFEPGEHASLTRNPNYWKPDTAFFEGIEMLSIRDSTARITALITDEVDVIDRVEFRLAEQIVNSPNVKLEEVAGSQHYTFAMDTRKEPFSDNNVRLAMKYGIDRQNLVDTILRGHGSPGNDHPIGPTYRFYASELEQREYDPDRARHHLKQAGLDSLQISLSASSAAFAGAVDAALLYREHAAKSDINIDVSREPADGYWSDVWMVEPFSAVFWRGRPTEDWIFSTVYETGAPWNDTFWNNERFNKLLAEARVELDEDKRREMYIEMQRLIRDDGGAVIPMFANYVSASSDRVRHADAVAASDDLDGMRFTERWWFAE